jgi:hypothetical protein
MIKDENFSLKEKLCFLASQSKTPTDKMDARKLSLRDFEDTFRAHLKDVADLDKRLSRHLKSFESSNAVAKLLIRDSEVQELERKFGQIEILIARILEEADVLIEKASHDP